MFRYRYVLSQFSRHDLAGMMQHESSQAHNSGPHLLSWSRPTSGSSRHVLARISRVHPVGARCGLFPLATHLAIRGPNSVLGGPWRESCKNAISKPASLRAVTFRACSSWSDLSAEARDTSPIFGQAGRADITHTGRTAIRAVAGFTGTLTAWFGSLETNSSTKGQSHYTLAELLNYGVSARSWRMTRRVSRRMQTRPEATQATQSYRFDNAHHRVHRPKAPC